MDGGRERATERSYGAFLRTSAPALEIMLISFKQVFDFEDIFETPTGKVTQMVRAGLAMPTGGHVTEYGHRNNLKCSLPVIK